ncbi:DUF6884 domain-containing protein [Phreatobacter cathodiphilus]|uniref:DUF6884 domain-containing protein n=1 Tax=Phreatobacter cathodiphilus TaxID=1868589 RepID=UPI0011B2207F|nr:DUF6884 domain-containing protein [Phreatobacter cathodiphilus]
MGARMQVDGSIQGDLFQPAKLIVRDALLGVDGRTPLMVLGCGRNKLTTRASAQSLYTSSRFRQSVDIAKQLNAPFVILSAKHGIVDSNAILEPYDLDLSILSEDDRLVWGEKALSDLAALASGRSITVLAESNYAQPLLQANKARLEPLTIVSPWVELSQPDRDLWLREAHHMAVRIRDLDRLYAWIEAKREAALVFPFGDLSAMTVPKRGVYLFLDPEEPNFRKAAPRVVRVGTHAVSAGSQASLRARLRTHLGPQHEIGNHRASIFRLHVGRAMLEARDGPNRLPSWGDGQNARRNVKGAEQDLEIAVSQYLRRLQLVLIEVDDEPSKYSVRAHTEMQLIALLSDSMRPIDMPSPTWLGLQSPVAPIRQLGLWNVRGIGGKYDSSGVGSVTSMLEA